jgi:signal transduction histidine kinase
VATFRAGVVQDKEIARLQTFTLFNVLGLASGIISMGAVELWVLHPPSRHLAEDLVILGVSEVAYIASWVLGRRGRRQHAVILLAAGSWLIAMGATAVTPFLLPLTTLIALGPVMVFSTFLSSRTVALATGVSVAVTAISAALAVAPLQGALDEPEPWLSAPILMVFIPVVAAGIAIGIWHNYSRLLEQAGQLRASRARVVAAGDEARRRLERDLHDGAQQRLVAMAMQLGLLGRLLERDPAAAAKALSALSEELHGAIADVRDLAQGLFPPMLAERGLASTLGSIVRRAPIPVEWETTDVGRYPADIEAAIYFGCLEAFTNAVKHSGAEQVRISLSGGSLLRFEVTDDGVGFDMTSTPAGTGLANMSDRLGAVGGTLTFVSAIGRGTTVSGAIPV